MTGKKAYDTSKDGVITEMVIREVGGGTSYHALIKTNYSDWALLMMVKLKALALWNIIKDGGTDHQEEMMTLDALCGAVPPEMVPMIIKKDTTKQAYAVIATMRVNEVWQNHLRNEGFISHDRIGGFSVKREYTNITHKYTIPYKVQVKVIID
jgi:hypothetical protein